MSFFRARRATLEGKFFEELREKKLSGERRVRGGSIRSTNRRDCVNFYCCSATPTKRQQLRAAVWVELAITKLGNNLLFHGGEEKKKTFFIQARATPRSVVFEVANSYIGLARLEPQSEFVVRKLFRDKNLCSYTSCSGEKSEKSSNLKASEVKSERKSESEKSSKRSKIQSWENFEA